MKSESKKNKHPNLTILIPVYNEERTINEILTLASGLPIKDYEIIIVNDASKDKSEEIIKRFMRSKKSPNPVITLETHPKNRGKGAAIQTALRMAHGEYFVIQDADSEYDPRDIPPLLDAAVSKKRPVVYGSRFKGDIKGMPRPNYYANRFYNFILRRLYDTDVTDMHTCYKMVRTDLIKEFNITSNGFDYATELVSRILRRGIPIFELPISFNGRTRKEGKKIGYIDGIECTYQIFKYRFSKKYV
jgi:glycosyltransferase involved in cell wall biosynthesis